MLENIEVLFHSSIRISKRKVIYIDPYSIQKNYMDADLIFITHSHFDHYSKEDIEKVKKENTIIIVPQDLKEKAINDGFSENNVLTVIPNKEYLVNDISFRTVPAYNIDKNFHPKSNNWVGYIIQIDNLKYYIAGDTDANEDNKKVICDIAFVPVGGTYTMKADEAAQFVNHIKPKIAIPIHYGSIVGTKNDAKTFVSLLDSKIEGRILM